MMQRPQYRTIIVETRPPGHDVRKAYEKTIEEIQGDEFIRQSMARGNFCPVTDAIRRRSTLQHQ